MKKARGFPKWAVVSATIVVLAVVLAGCGFLSFTAPVDAGHVAVVTEFGHVTGNRTEGLNFKTPWQVYNIFSSREVVYETSDDPSKSTADYRDVSVDGQTSDGQPITATYSIRFSVPASKAESVYRNVGESMDRVVERVVKFYSRSNVRLTLQQYSAEKLYSGEIYGVQAALEDKLRPLFESQGITLNSFVLRKIGFSPEYVKAVEAKQIQQQAIITAQYAADAEKNLAIQAVNKAQGQANAQIEIARGQAEAIKLQGAALRDNPQVLQYQMVQQLNNVPFVFLPSEGIANLLPLPTIPMTKTSK